ncbi:MAG: helix-turn-helix transcriptional regulator [Fimbriimonadaceae bacterium]|nr:helix-turn-helix transcriptional regulator [Chitinophagales bacterium]
MEPLNISTVQPIVFSKRETEVLKLIAQGKTSKEIAVELLLSIETIESHRKRMIKKVQTKNVYGVMAYGFFAGILKPEDVGLSNVQ